MSFKCNFKLGAGQNIKSFFSITTFVLPWGAQAALNGVVALTVAVTLVSLRNRTVERRGRQNAWVWQTWRGYYLRVLSGIHLTLLFLALLQKDLFKGMWSLAEGFFNENYCHACHTRFSAVFPLPSCCVSSLFFQFWRLMVKIEHREAPSRRIRIFFNPQLFLCGFGFQPHVSGESEKRNRDFLNLLSRVEIFEYAMNPERRGY